MFAASSLEIGTVVQNDICKSCSLESTNDCHGDVSADLSLRKAYVTGTSGDFPLVATD